MPKEKNSKFGMPNVALLQTNTQSDPNEMLKRIEFTISTLPKSVKFVATPENALLMSDKAQYQFYAQPENHQFIMQRLSALAKQYDLWLMLGSFPLLSKQTENKLTNSCLLFDNQGEIVVQYHKIHLFDANIQDNQSRYRESDTFDAGKDICVIDTPIGRLGLAICYDLRFPLLFQKLREHGAEIITLPAAFTVPTGEAHWEVLLRARAIETQCYILAPAQVGNHLLSNGQIRQTYGHSMIIDAWGNIVSQATNDHSHNDSEYSTELPEIILGYINRQSVHTIREKMPVFQHRILIG